MGLVAAARALTRAAYRLVRFQFHLVDDVVLPVIFDEQAPVRRVYGKFLLDCDGAAAHLLADDTAAVRAAFRDAIARHPSSIHIESDVAMMHHRARFRERRGVTHPPGHSPTRPPR